MIRFTQSTVSQYTVTPGLCATFASTGISYSILSNVSPESITLPISAGYIGRRQYRSDFRAALPLDRSTSISKAKRSDTLSGFPLFASCRKRIGYLLKRPVGRPSHDLPRSYANFTYQAGSWTKPRRVVAKIESNPGQLYPRVGLGSRPFRRATITIGIMQRAPTRRRNALSLRSRSGQRTIARY